MALGIGSCRPKLAPRGSRPAPFPARSSLLPLLTSSVCQSTLFSIPRPIGVAAVEASDSFPHPAADTKTTIPPRIGIHLHLCFSINAARPSPTCRAPASLMAGARPLQWPAVYSCSTETTSALPSPLKSPTAIAFGSDIPPRICFQFEMPVPLLTPNM